MKKKILICDDEKGASVSHAAKSWQKALNKIPAIKQNFEVKLIERVKFEEDVAKLEQRRKNARESNHSSSVPDTEFDTADILVIDYDLLYFDSNKEFITGEGVAYLARCYSKCGLIIVLNQFSKNNENTFDLTLKGHTESFADLNLSSKELSNSGLWEESFKAGKFRPWYWALLPKALASFNRRVKDLMEGGLDNPVLEYLLFPQPALDILPRSALEFIGREDKPRDVTFRQFVESSGNGLRPKDKPLNDEAIARIAAARISKWLERIILPGQDILVDAPHLLARFPSLLKPSLNKTTAIKAGWNETVCLTKVKSFNERNLKDFRFQKNEWLSRPAWFWTQVSNYDKIEEVTNPWNVNHPNLVFCEDTSSFMETGKASEFVANLQSPFLRRFVAKLSGVNYVPSVRFSL